MGYGFGWGNYVSAAEKRRKAQKKVAELKKQGRPIEPVHIEGRTIARSFWGKSWCDNLERYSDFESRLPRGRSYVRNGSVVDLKITRGEIAALVSGSRLYKVRIAISPVVAARWKAICGDCAGTVDSLVELLQGRLAKGVMDRVCREGDGLFPAPKEIQLSCSCPDWADMCKHVAATLYGVGARLDDEPRLLFALRGVDEGELLAGSRQDLARSTAASRTAKVLGDDDVAALFGLEMVEDAGGGIPAADTAKRSRAKKTLKRSAVAKAGKAAPPPARPKAKATAGKKRVRPTAAPSARR
ncbi:MAG: SWIM zinc finger family protein [Reyranella sp.]|nr:SWIM zinc finger family protein [Reyranella sp.]